MIRIDRATRRLPPGVRRVPGVQSPRGVEQDYYAEIRAYVLHARAVTRAILIPALDHVFVRTDDETSPHHGQIIKTAMGQIRYAVAVKAHPEAIARAAAGDVAKHNDKRSKKIKQLLPVNVEQSDPWLTPIIDNFVELNAALIRSIPEDALAEVEKIVRIAALSGTRPESLAQEIMERFDVGESRARLLARDQVSKLNGGITKTRQTKLGVTEYVWRTSLDERVRESHRRKEGKRFRWDDPPDDTGAPGEDYQCRCWAEAVLPDMEDDDA